MTLSSEVFVKMMQVAMDDPSVKEALLAVLAIDVSIRGYAIDQLISGMRMQGAPADFVEAISCLKDAAIARKAIDMLAAGAGK
jgi:hypothetical protein